MGTNSGTCEAEQRGEGDNLVPRVMPSRGWNHLSLVLFHGDCALLLLLILFTVEVLKRSLGNCT